MFSITLAFIACWKLLSGSISKALPLLFDGPAVSASASDFTVIGMLWLLAGRKMTLLFAVLAIACMASRYLICIAGAELRISAACLINLADSTSARAAMTLDSPILFDWAAIESESCKSLLKM